MNVRTVVGAPYPDEKKTGDGASPKGTGGALLARHRHPGVTNIANLQPFWYCVVP